MMSGGLQLVDDTLDAVPEVVLVEIEEQAQSMAAQPEVREQLRLMDRQELRGCLQFDDDQVSYNHVYAISNVHSQAVIADGKWPLRHHGDPLLPQLVCKARLVGALQETRPQHGMHSHGSIDDPAAAPIDGLD
jgi:hypothetical protein